VTTETKTTKQQYAALLGRRRELQAELAEVERDLGTLEESTLEEMLAEGMQSCRVDGMTLYIERQLWAGRGEHTSREITEALEAAGLADMTTANWQQLSSYVREQARNATGKEKPSAEEAIAALPDILRNVVSVTEAVKVRGRKSA